MAMPISQYFDLLVAALDGNKAAATTVLPETVDRGRDFETIMAWVAQVGPLGTADGDMSETSYNVQRQKFLASQDLFTTEEGVDIAVESLVNDGTLWRWHDQIDIQARAPEELKKMMEEAASKTDWRETAENVGLFTGGLLTGGLIWGVSRMVKRRYA